MALQWYKKSEFVKVQEEPVLAQVGRFRLSIVRVHNEWYVSIQIMKDNGRIFRIQHEKAFSLESAMKAGEESLKKILNEALCGFEQLEASTEKGSE